MNTLKREEFPRKNRGIEHDFCQGGLVHDFGHVVSDFQKEPAEAANGLLGARDIVLNGDAGDGGKETVKKPNHLAHRYF